MRYEGGQTFLMGCFSTLSISILLSPLYRTPLHLLPYLMALKQKQNAPSANLVATFHWTGI